MERDLLNAPFHVERFRKRGSDVNAFRQMVELLMQHEIADKVYGLWSHDTLIICTSPSYEADKTIGRNNIVIVDNPRSDVFEMRYAEDYSTNFGWHREGEQLLYRGGLRTEKGAGAAAQFIGDFVKEALEARGESPNSG